MLLSVTLHWCTEALWWLYSEQATLLTDKLPILSRFIFKLGRRLLKKKKSRHRPLRVFFRADTDTIISNQGELIYIYSKN